MDWWHAPVVQSLYLGGRGRRIQSSEPAWSLVRFLSQAQPSPSWIKSQDSTACTALLFLQREARLSVAHVGLLNISVFLSDRLLYPQGR